jgi:hypothetical protein
MFDSEDLEEMVEIVVEVKAGYAISTAETSKYANKYVDAFVGSYEKISLEGKRLLEEAGVYEQSHLSMKKVNNTLKKHQQEVAAAQLVIDRHNARLKRERNQTE